MPDFIASVDAGNGGTNAVIAKSNGGYKSVYFPSVRAAATGASLGLGKDLELEYEYVDWYGHRYVIGDDVIRVTRRNLERHMGSNRYGNEFHQFLVAVALSRLGVKKGTVDLTLFAPPGLYVDTKTIMQKRFMEQGGEVEIQLKGDRKPRIWTYENITVWPEGIGAAACFVLDDNGDFIETDVLSGETLILDCGAFTLDALKLVDGNFNPEALQHATWDNAGINIHVREPILRAIKEKSTEFSHLSVDDVDLVLRRGLAEGDYSLKVAGYEVDIESLVDKYVERYAGWIANNILDGVFENLRGIKSLILVGGGAAMIEDFMKEWYGNKLLNRKKHSATKKIHPVDFNAVGGIRFALMRLKQTGAG
jgi:hypothetical protein